jgi:hypothetical protein
MPLSTHDALIHLMVVAASSDMGISPAEIERIDGLIDQSPVFDGFDRSSLTRVANQCVDKVNSGADIETVLDEAVAALPPRLHDTAYALAVEVTAVDLRLEQEELRLLEMIRDRLQLDRLITAAIEAAARARYRRA